MAPALHFTLKDVDGKKVNLGRFQGDVIMVVNVASLCGNTPQYATLQKLYEKCSGSATVRRSSQEERIKQIERSLGMA